MQHSIRISALLKSSILFGFFCLLLPDFSKGIGWFPDGLAKDGHVYILNTDIQGDIGQKPFWTRPKMYPDLDKHAGISCVGGFRGYGCEWEINNDSLFLTQVTLFDHNMPNADLTKMFGNRCKHGRVFADWVSGEYEAYTERDDIGRFWMDFGGKGCYKVQVVWEVKNGHLQHWKRYEHPLNHVSELDTDRKALEKYIADELDYAFFPPKEGFPVGISIRLYFEADSMGHLKNIEVLCEESEYPLADFSARIKRILAGITDWTVLYDRGVFISRQYDKPVFIHRDRMSQNP